MDTGDPAVVAVWDPVMTCGICAQADMRRPCAHIAGDIGQGLWAVGECRDRHGEDQGPTAMIAATVRLNLSTVCLLLLR